MTTQTESLNLIHEQLQKLWLLGDKAAELANPALDAIKVALAQLEQEPVAWVPYLSDRADGVKGRYAIARWNPRGYREVWNLRRHEWGAYSDDVLSLEEADTLLRLITIPTRKVTSQQPPQPKEPEHVAALKKDEVFAASIDFIGTLTGMTPPPIEVAPPEVFKPFRDFTEKVCSILATPPQRKPLDIKTIKRIATYCGEHITDEDVIEITRRVEEEHKIKEET